MPAEAATAADADDDEEDGEDGEEADAAVSERAHTVLCGTLVGSLRQLGFARDGIVSSCGGSAAAGGGGSAGCRSSRTVFLLLDIIH